MDGWDGVGWMDGVGMVLVLVYMDGWMDGWMDGGLVYGDRWTVSGCGWFCRIDGGWALD